MCDDSDADAEYIRMKALELGEETRLARQGHTIHFDGYDDQGRAPGATKNLVSKEEVPLMKSLLAMDRGSRASGGSSDYEGNHAGQGSHCQTQLRRADPQPLFHRLRPDQRIPFMCATRKRSFTERL